MSWPIRVLHLEDNHIDRVLIAALLKQAELECEITGVETRAEFTRALYENPRHLILADLALPAFDGFSALSLARRLAPHTPFIFVSGVIGEELAVDSLKNGATDYVLKNHLERLAPAVTRALKEAAESHRLRESQEALYKSEERFRLLVQSIRDYAIYTVDPGGMVVSWNAGAEHIFGYCEREAIGRSARALFRDEDVGGNGYERLVHAAEEKGRTEQELWQVRKGGIPFWANLTLTPLPGIHGFAVITQDITERQRAAQELERSRQERARMQEKFLSHISHELRTPLTTIVDFTSLLAEGTAGQVSPEQKQYLEIVLRAANQLAVMVNRLLDLTRSDWHRLPIVQECVHVENLIAEVCEALVATAAAKNIELRNLTPPSLPLVFADPSRITEVVTNLIDNAIKYSPTGARVEIGAERSELDPDFVRVSVSDDGPGIDPQHRSRIFEQFFRVSDAPDSHPGGLGLGLYISREIVKAHGGKLSLPARESAGTTFQFTVPVFLLERLLTPIASPRNLAAQAVAVITVETPEMPNCTSVDQGRYMRSVRAVVRRCTHESSDLILPVMEVDGRPGLHIVAFTTEDGGSSIATRVQQELDASLELQPLEGQFEVSSQVLDLSDIDLEDIPRAVQKLANRVAMAIGLPSETGEQHERPQEQSVGDRR
jgi:PAS domain S-box-containing protein